MRYRNRKSRSCPALTILEIVIALAIITIIFAAVLPQFRVILNGWDSRQANTEVIQNGRVLIDHISRNLSKAVRITAVSSPSLTNGYIQFITDVNDSNTYRYDIGGDNYVEYGTVGSLSGLAGPVSSLTFTCYDVCDLNTPLSPVTDANVIRTVKVDATIINSDSPSQNKTFTAWAYLRTNAQGCWQHGDIGSVGAVGSASESDGTWTINGSGVDIWDTSDGFHYVYQSMSGNCQIIARVVSMTNTNAWAKAGVMIRETLTGGSKHAMMVVTPGSGTAFQRRTTTGGISDHTAGSVVTAPYWVKLVRTGDTFYGYESINGSVWTLVGSASVTMAADVYIGLAVTSHSDGVLCTAVIDSVGFSSVSYEGFTEAKAASDTTSITISTIGTVVTIGSWVNGLTQAVVAGSNRALIFIAHVEDNDGAINLSSVTYGGQSMTKVIDITSGAAGNREYVVAYRLGEAGIAAATSGTFVVNWGANPPDSVQYYSVFLQNVSQTTPIGATASNALTGATITTSALATGAGDMVIDAATCGGTGTYTVNNSFTQAYDLGVANFDGTAGYKSATGVSETPSVTHSTTTNLQALIGFVVKVREESGIVGDLLIAAVATDGDTSGSIAAPVGQGWTLIDRGAYSGAATLGAWWKLAGTSESASHQFTWSGSEQAYGWMMRFTGNNSTNPINTSATAGQTSITPASPAVATTVDNCLILRLGAFDNDNITVDSPGLTTPVSHTPITMDRSSNPTVTFVAAGTAVSGTGAVSPVWPTHQANDIGIMVIETGGEGTTLTPAGWTHVTGSPVIDVASTAGSKLHILWKRAASSSEASVSTGDSGDHQVAQIYTFRGVITTGNPWDVVATGTKTTASFTATAVSVTTTVANTLVLLIVGRPNDDSSTIHFGAFTNPNLTSITERGEAGTISGHGGGFVLTTGDKTTAGATGTSTSTKIFSTTDTYMTIALKPPQTAVSGGAGYIGQSSSGSSGTSNFALTASNASRMLTIAIAPADNNSCQGSIEP